MHSFSSNFETMPHAQQVQLLVSTHDALRTFYQSRDGRLDITPNSGISKHVLFFHLAYQMAQLITLPPFLRCFTSSASPSSPSRSNSNNPSGRGPGASLPDEENVTILILRSLTGAASTTIRLVRMYRDIGGWNHATASFPSATSPPTPPPAQPNSSSSAGAPTQPTGKPNPVIIHYLLSAAIVQLMNATSGSPSLRKSSARQLRTCMELLAQLRGPWRLRADKSIKVIRVLAQRWGVLGALPMNYSYRVEPAEQVDVGMSSQMGGDVPKGGEGSSSAAAAAAASGIPGSGSMPLYGGAMAGGTSTSTSTGGVAVDPSSSSSSMGVLGSNWGSTAAAAASSMMGMANMGMPDASPPTDDADFNFLGPSNMATNLEFFDTMAGGTYVNWMHEFEALNGYDWASTAEMNGATL